MSMALRTQMQIKCCCSAYPPEYECDCYDLKRQFVLGQIPQPRTITIDLNLTNGTCDFYNTAGGNNCEGVPANCTDCVAHCGGCGYACGCPTYNDDPGCDNLAPSPPKRANPVGTANHHWIVAKNVDEPLSTNCVSEGFTDSKTGLCYGEWTLHHGGELWFWDGPGWVSFCPDDDHIGCGAGSDVGKKAEFVNSPVASAIDGSTHLRLFSDLPNWGGTTYVPDEDYYGDWYYEAGGGSDSLAWGSGAKVPFTEATSNEFYLWNDGSTDIGAVYIWHKPPSGWACGDATPQYAEALLIDIVGGSDEGRHEISCAGKTIKDLDVAVGAINSALHILCNGTLRTTPIDKIQFGSQKTVAPVGRINNRGCVYHNDELCPMQPPEFPPLGCGWYYDPYVISGVQTNAYVTLHGRRNAFSIGYIDRARMRGTGGPIEDRRIEALFLKSDTDNSGTYGSDLTFNFTGGWSYYSVSIECFDSSGLTDPPDGLNTSARGWQIKWGGPSIPGIESKPIGYNCYGVGGQSESTMYANWINQGYTISQRYMITADNQGDCGLNLLEKSYLDWHGNRLSNNYRKGASIDQPPWTCVNEDLPRPELGVYSASNICNYINAPGVHVDTEHCDGKVCASGPLWHFHAQLAGIEVTELFDYPEVSCFTASNGYVWCN